MKTFRILVVVALALILTGVGVLVFQGRTQVDEAKRTTCISEAVAYANVYSILTNTLDDSAETRQATATLWKSALDLMNKCDLPHPVPSFATSTTLP